MTPKYSKTKFYSSNTITDKGDSNRYLPKNLTKVARSIIWRFT